MALNMRDPLAKTRFLRHALAALSLALALAGCDSFSLLDLLVLPGEGAPGPLSLTAATTTVARNGAPVALSVSGGRPPYNFSVYADDPYGGTSGQPIGDVYNLAYEPGGAIGRMRVTVTDARGESAQITISVVPRTPSLTIEWQAHDIRIAWLYTDTAVITGFSIMKSVNGGPFSDFSSLFLPGSNSTIDNETPLGSTYTYRIYAIAGDYYSLPSNEARLQ